MFAAGDRSEIVRSLTVATTAVLAEPAALLAL